MKQGKFALGAVESLTGVGRSTLGRYARDGVLKSIRKGRLQSAGWDIDLLEVVAEMQALRAIGWSAEDAERLLNKGPAVLREKAHESYHARFRQSRRSLKCADALQRRFEALDYEAGPDRIHLRYIPERWYALLPLPHNAKVLPYGEGFTEAAALLNSITSCAGWCAHPSFSTMTSFDTEFGAPRSFVMQELASLPMPDPAATELDDCGCYRVFQQESEPCAGGVCWQCSRFGRKPSLAERRNWTSYGKKHPEVTSVLLSADSALPAQGPWGLDGPAIARTPQLMPLADPLPCGAGACLMPGGFYLTMQDDDRSLESIREHLLGILMMLDNICLIPTVPAAETDAGHTESASGADDAGEPSGFRSTVKMPSGRNEPMHSWTIPVSTADLDKIKLIENASVSSKAGLSLLIDSLPVMEAGAPPRFEVQALVDATDLLKDGRTDPNNARS